MALKSHAHYVTLSKKYRRLQTRVRGIKFQKIIPWNPLEIVVSFVLHIPYHYPYHNLEILRSMSQLKMYSQFIPILLISQILIYSYNNIINAINFQYRLTILIPISNPLLPAHSGTRRR